MGKCNSTENQNINGLSNRKIRKDDITKYFTLTDEKLGEGVSSVVMKAYDTKGKVYAIKIIDKTKCTDLSFLKKEIEISLSVYHEHIIHYYDAFKTATNYFIVMEWIQGGDLFQYITNSSQGKLSEMESIEIFQQITNVLVYLHEEKKVVHRDIKPENFLIETINGRPSLKLIDFGFSISNKEIKRKNSQKNGINIGTDIYLAPEILLGFNKKNPLNEKVDIWAAGVVLINMLTGSSPFTKENSEVSFDKQIIKGNLDCSFISNETLKLLCQSLFEKKPEYRPSALEIANILKNFTKSKLMSCDSFKLQKDSIESMKDDNTMAS